MALQKTTQKGSLFSVWFDFVADERYHEFYSVAFDLKLMPFYLGLGPVGAVHRPKPVKNFVIRAGFFILFFEPGR